MHVSFQVYLVHVKRFRGFGKKTSYCKSGLLLNLRLREIVQQLLGALKEPSSILLRFFQTVPDFGIRRKLTFFSITPKNDKNVTIISAIKIDTRCT